jgi:ribonucleoside-diphosphate reductase alpha chain
MTINNLIESIPEVLFLAMSGVGVGISVQKKFIDQIAPVPEMFNVSNQPIVVADSRAGWLEATRQLIIQLYSGIAPTWNLAFLRPEGAILKTSGGQSSGPEPLDELFRFICSKFFEAHGRQFRSIEVYDIMCYVTKCVVSGGKRRGAMIVLFDIDDQEMIDSKNLDNIIKYSWRSNSNNSVYLESEPTESDLDILLKKIENNNFIEPGIFNFACCKKKLQACGRYDNESNFLTNPCGEIILRSRQTCNLTTFICRSNDTIESLRHKVTIATIWGVLQAKLANFPRLDVEWIVNSYQDPLIGVSPSGCRDCPLMSKPEVLVELRQLVHTIALEWANRLNIKKPKSCTTVKPSGTISLMANCSSGIQSQYSRFFKRRIYFTNTDPILKVLKEQGFECSRV